MDDQGRTEEVTIRCTEYGAIYPAFRLPDGTLTRASNAGVEVIHVLI